MLTTNHREASLALDVPLVIDGPASAAPQSLTAGLPFPRGVIPVAQALSLVAADGMLVPCQTAPLATWPDGSVRWLLVDCVAGPLPAGRQTWHLTHAQPSSSGSSCKASADGAAFAVDTGAATFRVGRAAGEPWLSAAVTGRDLLDPAATGVVWTDAKGRARVPHVERSELECAGPVRTTIRLSGAFAGRPRVRFIARFCFFAGTGLVRLRLTVHNPRRARHRGGLWDLGDPGSILFRDLSLTVALREASGARTSWTEEPGASNHSAPDGRLEIYQDSSGGENWQSRNHVNRHGRVPTSFRGYRVRAGGTERTGLRASPVVRLAGPGAAVAAAIPEFWQQFPKAVESDGGALHLRLFPRQFGDFFELQGGEQKTQTVWLHFGGPAAPATPLDWVHAPADLRAEPDWYARSGAFPDLLPRAGDPSTSWSTAHGAVGAGSPRPRSVEGGETPPLPRHGPTDLRLDDYLRPALEGPNSLVARRELIDEYGWRNFGDLYADHENRFATAPKPVVSHYNNQFDVVLGGIVQYARTGDRRWRDLFDPLARHVVDIDVYHTDEDRAAYRGGLFWMTDHYLDAATSTHRTFSAANQVPGKPYGGGPGSAHNFTTGLLYYHYLTGDPLAREAVLSLADWVVRMDDGRLNVFGLLDDGPTGLTSFTIDPDYHGPGRGPGFSVNALLDGWLLTGRRPYLEKAEELIRRVIHPADDLAARDLLNAELRWSYPVFLVALARYLRLKADAGEIDGAYAYGRAALLHYAGWMAEHERPYLDRAEELEFRTETWPAQEFRKANAMRLAAAHAAEPLRGRLLERGAEFAERAWHDLLGFANPHTTRAVAILLTEGCRDQCFRQRPPAEAPPPATPIEFGLPAAFVSQKRRVKALLRSPLRLGRSLAGLPRRAVRWLAGR